MASETGGRVIDVHNEKTLEKAFDEITDELRYQYVLGYYPTNEKRDGTFRKIQVELQNHSDVKSWPAKATTRREGSSLHLLAGGDDGGAVLKYPLRVRTINPLRSVCTSILR
jgi:hypothetical protein